MDIKNTGHKIELNIDELKINGTGPISEIQLRRAVEQELTRRFGKKNLQVDWNLENRKIKIDELDVKINHDSGVKDIGHQVAQHVHTATPIKSFCGGSGGAVFSKRAPLAAGGKK